MTKAWSPTGEVRYLEELQQRQQEPQRLPLKEVGVLLAAKCLLKDPSEPMQAIGQEPGQSEDGGGQASFVDRRQRRGLYAE